MYSGGFEFYVYGIKGIFSFEIYDSWGGFRVDKKEYLQLRENWKRQENIRIKNNQ